MEAKKEVKITEKDVIELMDLFNRIPSILLERWVSKNSNLVKSFETQLESYKNQISDEKHGKNKGTLKNAGQQTSKNIE